jgi:serine/threonine protein kinase
MSRKPPSTKLQNEAIKSYNEKVDVWAIGVLLHELVFGRAPFAARTPAATAKNIMRGFDGTFPTRVCLRPFFDTFQKN